MNQWRQEIIASLPLSLLKEKKHYFPIVDYYMYWLAMLVYRPILNSCSHSLDIPKRRIFFSNKKNAVYKYKLLSRFRWLV